MRIDAEKVPRQNINCLPLAPELWTMIEFYQQHVRPILLAGPRGTTQSKCKALWVNVVRFRMMIIILIYIYTICMMMRNVLIHWLV